MIIINVKSNDKTAIPIKSEKINFFFSGKLTNNWYWLIPSLSVKIGMLYVSLLLNLNLFDLTFKTYEAVALYLHAGVGLGLVSSVNEENTNGYPGSGNERQGQAIIGLSPRFRISEKISIFTDFSYFAIFKQHIYYNGQKFTPDNPTDFEPGQGASHMTFSFGLVYNLGNRRYHADWY